MWKIFRLKDLKTFWTEKFLLIKECLFQIFLCQKALGNQRNSSMKNENTVAYLKYMYIL